MIVALGSTGQARAPDGPVPSGRVVAVVGATATGKSDLAVRLAHELGGEVVNADAFQLYRGMDIGTAKLSVAERAGVPHHLLDVLDVTQDAAVAAYQRQARAAIDGVLAAGRVPVLVGGSGLYVRAALDHLDIPPTDPRLRARLAAQAQQRGPQAMHLRLAEVDPAAAARILPGNVRRTVRALEVIELTGRPFTAQLPVPAYRRPTVQIALRWERALLDERIAVRVRRMWDAGLVDETRRLDQAGLRHGRTASRAVGYVQVLAQLDGALDEAHAQEQAVRATRRLARRQESWFGRDQRLLWLPADDPDLLSRAVTAVADVAG
ncbi:MAG: tRNA (adenosine(37)-N6)-dimethylallyltransferase MiaA [Angustibacter sp.]